MKTKSSKERNFKPFLYIIMILHRSNEELFQSFQKICFPFGLSAGLGKQCIFGWDTYNSKYPLLLGA